MRITLLVALFALCSTAAYAGDGPDEPGRPAGRHALGFQVFGYHAWWMQDSWKAYDYGTLDKLMFFELRAAADGSIAETNGWTEQGADLVHQARRRSTPVVPTVAVLDEAAGPDGRPATTLTTTVTYASRAVRDSVLASPMEHGVAEGYRRLDAVLAARA